MKFKKIIKYILHPYYFPLIALFRLKGYWISIMCKSYSDVFNYERKNNFSYTKTKANLHLGVEINLDKPKTFNEKLIHRRLFSRDPIWPIVTDKIGVRKWLKDQGYLNLVHLVPAKIVFSVDDLFALNIDRPVVVKAAWASGMNLFVSSTEELLNYETTLVKWLNEPYFPRRLIWAPEEMKRGFLIEDSIADANGNVPVDYKFHCFDGVVEFFHIDIDRFKEHKRLLYSRDCQVLDWIYGKERYEGEFPIDAELIKKMVAVAEKISQKFSYVRVDLYCYKSEIYFGEITQTQGAGFEKFSDSELNDFYGAKWEYPNTEKLGDMLLSESNRW